MLDLLNESIEALTSPMVWIVAFASGVVTRQAFGASIMAALFAIIWTVINTTRLPFGETMLSVSAPYALSAAFVAALIGFCSGELTRESA